MPSFLPFISKRVSSVPSIRPLGFVQTNVDISAKYFNHARWSWLGKKERSCFCILTGVLVYCVEFRNSWLEFACGNNRGLIKQRCRILSKICHACQPQIAMTKCFVILLRDFSRWTFNYNERIVWNVRLRFLQFSFKISQRFDSLKLTGKK